MFLMREQPCSFEAVFPPIQSWRGNVLSLIDWERPFDNGVANDWCTPQAAAWLQFFGIAAPRKRPRLRPRNSSIYSNSYAVRIVGVGVYYLRSVVTFFK